MKSILPRPPDGALREFDIGPVRAVAVEAFRRIAVMAEQLILGRKITAHYIEHDAVRPHALAMLGATAGNMVDREEFDVALTATGAAATVRREHASTTVCVFAQAARLDLLGILSFPFSDVGGCRHQGILL